MGSQKNHLREMVLLSTNNKCFDCMKWKYTMLYTHNLGLYWNPVAIYTLVVHLNCMYILFEPVHGISDNVVCATSKASDQPAHTRSLIRAFASRLSIL